MKIGMTPNMPEVNDTSRYSIQQAVALLGVHKNTLYGWMSKGVFKPREWGYRKATGRRYITGRGLKRVWLETY